MLSCSCENRENETCRKRREICQNSKRSYSMILRIHSFYANLLANRLANPNPNTNNDANSIIPIKNTFNQKNN